MEISAESLDRGVTKAVRRFWTVRSRQSRRQGGNDSEAKDRGGRSAVTGGRQMDGFVDLVRTLLEETGLDSDAICYRTKTALPGWYRPEKEWDLLVVIKQQLVAAVEFKSQVGSFGNNFNNRAEESLGTAVDLWSAYREGAFSPSPQPWLGYLMLLESAPQSTRPVNVAQPHFPAFPEFVGASYAQRYELMLTKLIRDRHYNAGCLLLSERSAGTRGKYTEPSAELSFRSFWFSLSAHASAAVRLHGK